MHPSFRSPAAVLISNVFRDVAKVLFVLSYDAACFTPNDDSDTKYEISQESAKHDLGHCSSTLVRQTWEQTCKCAYTTHVTMI